MTQITIDLPFDKIVDTVRRLSDEQQEQLFFAINKDYAKALKKMKDEAWKEHHKGNSLSIDNL